MIQVYWKNATDKAVGPVHGITPEDLAGIEPEIQRAHGKLQQQTADGSLGYTTLPGRSDYLTQVKGLVERYKPGTTDLIVLGIGGSALGNIALQRALNPATYNLLSDRKRGGPRLFVLDNVDPSTVGDTMAMLGRRLRTTLVNVISKSGETAEPASQFMIFREMMRDKLGEDFASRIIATTDEKKGTLHEIAKADGYDMLPVPGDVGGRFSVLSPVGLFSAGMCGIDIDQLLLGAQAMQARIGNLPWNQNPATILAAIKFIAMTAKGKPMHVMMPYSDRLSLMADWYRQLWAESLGKQYDLDGKEVFTGPTPIKALGTTDQHSQVQLYREGPNDKLTVFLEVKKHPRSVTVPDVFGDIPGLTYLRKTSMAKILMAEKKATEYAMAHSQRPTVTIRFDEITPFSIGEFIYLYEYVTSLCGEMLNINTYDQPAVELGKKATFALLGRDGYDDVAAEMKPYMRTDKKYLA